MSASSGRRLRVTVDTNVFISGTILTRGNPFVLLEAWRAGAFILVLSTFQRLEIAGVLLRRRVVDPYEVTSEDREGLLRRLDNDSEFVVPLPELPLPLRDPKDVRIQGTALAVGADFLVTGDKDLHAVAGDPRLGTLKIVTVAEFLVILSERESNDREDNAEPGERAPNGIVGS